MTEDAKVILARDNVKRSIEFPFDVCLSRRAAEMLVKCLSEKLAGDFTYGWIRVSIERVEHEEGTFPRNWTD